MGHRPVKEKAVWVSINARTGRKILPDGEKTRPLYLGGVIDLSTGIEHVPGVRPPREPDENQDSESASDY